jgi:selenium metabolism protein YedF
MSNSNSNRRENIVSLDKNLLLILKSSGLGDGAPDLSEKLLKMFLNVLYESGTYPAKIVCLNSGIFLTTGASEAAESLAKFQKEGTEVLSCSTCLDYYGRLDRLVIGKPTNMRDTVAAMLNFPKVLSP